MENNKIIIKSKKQDFDDIFAMIIALLAVLIFGFQVMAGRQIKKANKEFIESEMAKNTVVDDSSRRAKLEQLIEKDRLQRQQEEEELLSSAEVKNVSKEESRIAKAEKNMDYRKKLNIYRHTGQNPK